VEYFSGVLVGSRSDCNAGKHHVGAFHFDDVIMGADRHKMPKGWLLSCLGTMWTFAWASTWSYRGETDCHCAFGIEKAG
jgi:hypothetical protein